MSSQYRRILLANLVLEGGTALNCILVSNLSCLCIVDWLADSCHQQQIFLLVRVVSAAIRTGFLLFLIHDPIVMQMVDETSHA